MKFAAKSKFLKVTILWGASLSHSIQQAQIQARFSVGSGGGGQGACSLGNFWNQVSQISRNWITDYLLWRYFYFSFSHKLLLQLKMFSKHITPIVLNFHRQRHFDDCLYEPGSVLNCALKLRAFFRKILIMNTTRFYGLCTFPYFQSLWSRSFKLWRSIELIMK